MLWAHRLPEASRQVSTGEGRVDLYYEEFATIVELDGMRDHSDWSKDMFRDNAHALRNGVVTLRFGIRGVTVESCRAARQLAARLQQAGWKGEPRNCPICRKSR